MAYQIKSCPEDFIVDEMLNDGQVASKLRMEGGSGAYVWVSVRKVGWNTIDLANIIAERLGISRKRVNYAGIKDKIAIAYQVFSMRTDMDAEQVVDVISAIKNVSVSCAWRKNRWIRSDDIIGNRFKITVRDCNVFPEPISRFPNFFGEQRFGSVKGNTARVGELVLKGKHAEAFKEYYGCRADSPERWIKTNWRLFKFCVHAFQSKLFNEELSMRLKDGELGVLDGEYMCGDDRYGFADINSEGSDFVVTPLIGYRTAELNSYKRLLLDSYKISLDDFRNLDIKGGWRTLHARVVGLEIEQHDNGLVHIAFSLQKGSYATELLKELFAKYE